MKLIKTAFLIALFNYLMVGAIVLAFKKPGEQNITSTPLPMSVTPTKTSIKTVKKANAPVTTTQTNTQNLVVDVVPTTPPVVVDNRCIVTIDGGRYDVSQFRNLHSGGDIFQCGTDMSAIFHGQHDSSYLSRMSQYKI